MKDIYIIGASGFGKEVAWLIEELDNWNVIGFIDDNSELQGKKVNGIPVLGNLNYFDNIDKEIDAVIAIGNPNIRKKIISKLEHKKNLKFPNIIAKDVRIAKSIQLGIGNIICSGSILTTHIILGNFNIINLSCTVGHDVILHDYITIYPSVNVSGNVEIDNCCELGTGTKIIQGKTITSHVIIGAGSVIVKNLELSGTYVGVPAKIIKQV